MTLYKFLAHGRRHPLGGVELPPAGEWIEAGDVASDGPEGVRACTAADLAHWLGDELWEVELDGERTILPCSVVAPRGRLVRRVDGWTAAVAQELAEAAAARARGILADRPEEDGPVDADAFLGDTLDDVADGSPTDALVSATAALAGWDEAAQRVERHWQSTWIVDRLGLDAG